MRWKMATSPCFSGDMVAKFQMLTDAIASANAILLSERRSRDAIVAHKVTLLNGELVGALTMKIVVGNAALRMMFEEDVKTGDIDPNSLTKEVEDCMEQLLKFADTYILSCLPSSECEVLYGRSGYLKAIKLIQTELSDSNFGRNAARTVLAHIGGGK